MKLNAMAHLVQEFNNNYKTYNQYKHYDLLFEMAKNNSQATNNQNQMIFDYEMQLH